MKNKILGLIKKENAIHIITAVLSVMMLLLIVVYRTTMKISEHPMSTYDFDLEIVSKSISDKYRIMNLNQQAYEEDLRAIEIAKETVRQLPHPIP